MNWITHTKTHTCNFISRYTSVWPFIWFYVHARVSSKKCHYIAHSLPLSAHTPQSYYYQSISSCREKLCEAAIRLLLSVHQAQVLYAGVLYIIHFYGDLSNNSHTQKNNRKSKANSEMYPFNNPIQYTRARRRRHKNASIHFNSQPWNLAHQ